MYMLMVQGQGQGSEATRREHAGIVQPAAAQ